MSATAQQEDGDNSTPTAPRRLQIQVPANLIKADPINNGTAENSKHFNRTKSGTEYSSVGSSTDSIASDGLPVHSHHHPHPNLSGLVVTTEAEEQRHSKRRSMESMMEDLKQHLDKTIGEIREQSRRDFEKGTWVM
jgi:hypothetical protein